MRQTIIDLWKRYKIRMLTLASDIIKAQTINVMIYGYNLCQPRTRDTLRIRFFQNRVFTTDTKGTIAFGNCFQNVWHTFQRI